MNTKRGFLIAGLCGACALAMVQNAQAALPPELNLPRLDPADQPDPASTPALTRAEALLLVAAAKKYEAHPTKKPDEVVTKPKVLTPDFDMATPPPSPRPEAKLPEPQGGGMVWVAGHYMPVKGEWRWVRGEWAVPALPISVWIPAKYDETTKKWSPGYWQPDAPSSDNPRPAEKDTKAAVPAKSPEGY